MSDKKKQEQPPNTVIIEIKNGDPHIKNVTHVIDKSIPQPKPQAGES